MWTKTKEKYNYFFLLFLLSFHVIFKFTKTTYFNLLKNNLFSSAFDLIIEKHTFNISLLREYIFSVHFLSKSQSKGPKKRLKKMLITKYSLQKVGVKVMKSGSRYGIFNIYILIR